MTHATGADMALAQGLARAADVAIVVLASSSTEGHDRANISLGGDELVAPIAKVGPLAGPPCTPCAQLCA